MSKQEELDNLKERAILLHTCKLCKHRKNFVFGEGDADSEIMIIGEAPGKDEDEQGRPFVGRSGQLLTRIIENGMKIKRSDIYISNIVKCRPTKDNLGELDIPPSKEDIESARWIIEEQINIIKPKIILAVGNTSARFLLNTKEGITKTHGNIYDYKNTKVMPIYHPSYILRNGGEKSPLKKVVWEDIKKAMDYLGMKY